MKAPEERTAERVFVEKAMAMVRGALYPGVTDSVFAREWEDIVLAISEPPAYLHERGLRLPGGRYLAILKEVIDGIRKEGALGRSRSRPMYLRKCVQDHMRIRGERYIEEAKGLQSRAAGPIAEALIRKMRVTPGNPEAEKLTEALVAARGLIAASRVPASSRHSGKFPKPLSLRRFRAPLFSDRLSGLRLALFRDSQGISALFRVL
jgi:hypothetical protein